MCHIYPCSMLQSEHAACGKNTSSCAAHKTWFFSTNCWSTVMGESHPKNVVSDTENRDALIHGLKNPRKPPCTTSKNWYRSGPTEPDELRENHRNFLGSIAQIGAERLEFHEECGVKQKKTKTGRLKFVNHPKWLSHVYPCFIHVYHVFIHVYPCLCYSQPFQAGALTTKKGQPMTWPSHEVPVWRLIFTGFSWEFETLFQFGFTFSQ
jgi:hypothetical protein